MASLLKDLVTRVQRLADRVDSSYRTRTLEAINEAIQWYSSRVPHDSAIHPGEIFLANGSEFLALPDRVARPLSVGDKSNAQRVRPGNQWESRNPSSYYQRTPGNAQEWRLVGMTPVMRQPATDVTLMFSTPVSDGMTIVVRGLVFDSSASGTSLELREVRETITMQGVTEFSANAYRHLVAIQKDGGTVAELNVGYEDTIQARIAPWDSRSLYQQLQFMFVPPAGTEIEVSYLRRPDRLTSEDDAVPSYVNEEAIVWRAAGNLHWMDQESQAAQVAWQKAEEELTRVRNQEQSFGERDNSVQIWGNGGYVAFEDFGAEGYY